MSPRQIFLKLSSIKNRIVGSSGTEIPSGGRTRTKVPTIRRTRTELQLSRTLHRRIDRLGVGRWTKLRIRIDGRAINRGSGVWILIRMKEPNN